MPWKRPAATTPTSSAIATPAASTCAAAGWWTPSWAGSDGVTTGAGTVVAAGPPSEVRAALSGRRAPGGRHLGDGLRVGGLLRHGRRLCRMVTRPPAVHPHRDDA